MESMEIIIAVGNKDGSGYLHEGRVRKMILSIYTTVV